MVESPPTGHRTRNCQSGTRIRHLSFGWKHTSSGLLDPFGESCSNVIAAHPFVATGIGARLSCHTAENSWLNHPLPAIVLGTASPARGYGIFRSDGNIPPQGCWTHSAKDAV